ncbi:plasmid segregation protein ParM (plasmid) [Lysinibacillus capsici]|uniref:ParM/StbA family protein n=1 Tax=Lysinibacillus capsici TaxID=2115968 RepID=UPI0021D8D964|nr:plasmid segregation protein ParM domain-containing protein [Lysinibacillus capsici]UYB50144.1 plasmid segregation protein ParM [Lysinibacillus capsici]UYB50218.1 plasmid segregation protein ParM [Lysinibacillus capsici]
MVLFALDLGNKQVKIKSDKTEKVLPGYFVEASQYGNRDLLKFTKGEKDARDYESPNDKGFTYVWGKDLDVDMVEQVTDASGFGLARYTSREFQLLADFALAELAREYEESKSNLVVNVVTGLPTGDFSNKKITEAVAKVLKGAHIVTIDGEQVAVTVNKLWILPQPLGTVLDYISDESGTVVNHELDEANIGIVDVGGGTLLIDALKKMNLVEDKRDQLSRGSYTLYKSILKQLREDDHTLDEYELEQIIRNASDDKYLWSPDGIQKIDIGYAIKEQSKLYTRSVTSAVKATYKGFGRMQKILVTGGTANLLDDEEFKKDISIAQIVEESELANVRGFYKYGLNKGE